MQPVEAVGDWVADIGACERLEAVGVEDDERRAVGVAAENDGEQDAVVLAFCAGPFDEDGFAGVAGRFLPGLSPEAPPCSRWVLISLFLAAASRCPCERGIPQATDQTASASLAPHRLTGEHQLCRRPFAGAARAPGKRLGALAPRRQHLPPDWHAFR